MKHRLKPLAAPTALVLVTLAALVGVGRSSSDEARAAAQAVPTNTAPPTIAGTPQVHAVLTATRGGWANDDGQTQYQWQRCATTSEATCVDIPGETTNSRTVQPDDAGDYLRVKTRAHNSDGWSPFVSSSMTAQVAAAQTPVSTELPAVRGTAREGETLEAARGEWANFPTAYAYQWQRCNAEGGSCANIPGETAAVRIATAGDVGNRLRVVVTASNSAGSSSAASAPSSVIGPRGSAPSNTAAPSVSGDAEVGKTLTVSNGAWTNNPTSYAYQWQRCNADGSGCANIPGETRQSRTLTPDDQGRRLRAAVTATNAFGSTQALSGLSNVVGSGLPAGAIRLADGLTSIPVTSVSLPHRLVIQRVSFSPNPVRSRVGAVTGRFRVMDTRGYVVRGALVFARSTPILTSTPPEQPTADDGWAKMTFFPRADFPLRNGYNVQFFLRARKPGDDVLAGISTRRLVQVRTARP